MMNYFKHTYKTLIVSCQAVENEPLNDTKAITLMAKACIEGGAKSLRISQPAHIRSIMNYIKTHKLNVPVIAIYKKKYPGCDVFITPTIKEVKEVLKFKPDVIAIDATLRKRPKESLAEIVKFIRKNYPKQIIMADCSNKDDVLNADKLGFDIVGTTLRGCTKETKGLNNYQNNFEFIKWCTKHIKAKLILEGGIWDPELARKALKTTNIHAIVVGSAITRPLEITKKYLSVINRK